MRVRHEQNFFDQTRTLPPEPRMGEVPAWANGMDDPGYWSAIEAASVLEIDQDYTPRAVPTTPQENPIASITLEPIGRRNLPPRPWAYGKYLLFGSAAVLGAVDGGGKGAIATVIALCMVTGQPLLGEKVWRTGPVAIVTYEDDTTEWHRRIAAACEHYQLDYDACMEQIHFLHHIDRRVSFGQVLEGRFLLPDADSIVDRLTEIGAVLLIVDPFNHAHMLDDGNNNVMIAKVADGMSQIAARARAAVLVLHHLRKGATGNPDDLMGATSLRATFRSCRILARMTPEIAEKMQITQPWRYTRVVGSKENYAPPPDKTTWYKLVSVALENQTDDYPEGDDIGVATTWTPRPMFEGMDEPVLRAVFERLRTTPHSPSKQSRNIPWAGLPLGDLGGRSETEALSIIAAWLETGVLTKADHLDRSVKRKVECVVLDELRVAEILADLSVISSPAG